MSACIDPKAVAERRKNTRAVLTQKTEEFEELFSRYKFQRVGRCGTVGMVIEGKNGVGTLTYDLAHDWWCFIARYKEPVDHRAELFVPHGLPSRVLLAAIRELFSPAEPIVQCESCGLEKTGGPFPHTELMDEGWSISADFNGRSALNVRGRCPTCRSK